MGMLDMYTEKGLKATREHVIELIQRWESENRAVRYDFVTTDHALEINLPEFLCVRRDLNDPAAFWLVVEHLEPGVRTDRVHVKLVSADSYDITDIRKEGHPTFKVKVDYVTCLTVPIGDFGTLYVYELETAEDGKVM
jgi:hypothetical protein